MKQLVYLLACGLIALGTHAVAETNYYLDCERGKDASDALRPDSAWKTVAAANAHSFLPGDTLQLKRGTTCSGMLWPKGSGEEGKPITISAYGVGALPRIVASGNPAGLKLFDQQYWHIEKLEIVGGNPYGIFISGAAASLSHFRISNVVVHDVTGEIVSKNSGLVVIGAIDKSTTLINDVLIDGVTAYNTTQWAGIIVNGANFSGVADTVRGSDITVKNSIVHDVGGDGILLARVKKGLIERNVAWNTGMQSTESIGTPNAIWEWMCEDCVVQYNEGFFSDSPGVDGGIFDIDYGDINNTVQYNYGHDSQGYCVSIFGAENKLGNSLNSIVRRNLCVHNGRSPRLAKRQGAIFLYTWKGGHLSGVQVYGNTVYWNPPLDAAAIVNEAEIDASALRIFADNLIVSSVPSLIRSNSGLQFMGNQYWHDGSGKPTWRYQGENFTALSAWQAIGQERRGQYKNPHLGSYFEPHSSPADAMKQEAERIPCVDDIYSAQPVNGQCVPGAVMPRESSNAKPGPLPALTDIGGKTSYSPHGWTLLAVLAPEGSPEADPSRSQVVVLESMMQQFYDLGLHIDITSCGALTAQAAVNWAQDWNFERLQMPADLNSKRTCELLHVGTLPAVFLISPDKTIVRSWSGLASFADVGLTLRMLLGTPRGAQALDTDASAPRDK